MKLRTTLTGWLLTTASAHQSDGQQRTGVERARCERHEKMECRRKVGAFVRCEPNTGHEFMRRVRDHAKAIPMGH